LGGLYLITVEVPDDIAEGHKYRDPDTDETFDLYFLPFDLINTFPRTCQKLWP
jgi:hypothetical protein